MPKFFEVEIINRVQSSDDPVVSTNLIDTSLGRIVAQRISYRRGMPNTKYGLWHETRVKTSPQLATSDVGALPDPQDYSRPYVPAEPREDSSGSMPSREVYVVKVAESEEDKRRLAGVLRLEQQINGVIEFFP